MTTYRDDNSMKRFTYRTDNTFSPVVLMSRNVSVFVQRFPCKCIRSTSSKLIIPRYMHICLTSKHRWVRGLITNIIVFTQLYWFVFCKGNFLYSAVSSLQDRSKGFTLYFPDRPVHSDTISASLGRSNVERKTKHTHSFDTTAQDLNPGSRSRESEALPLSHCALLIRLKTEGDFNQICWFLE